MKLATAWLLLLCAAGCAKKEPKPLRTEPWLAHPPPSASANGDAGASLTRYVLDERSVLRFELPSKRATLHGSITRVSGELDVDLSDLTRSRGWVHADLTSLTVQLTGAESDAALLERARAALELGPADSATNNLASFDLTSIEDATPVPIEAPAKRDAGLPASRRTHFTALGNLLVHGFRVPRRAPLSAEFIFAGSGQLPSSVSIRSRAPLVVSLETHAIVAIAGENAAKGPAAAPAQVREARVTVELYGTKLN